MYSNTSNENSLHFSVMYYKDSQRRAITTLSPYIMETKHKILYVCLGFASFPGCITTYIAQGRLLSHAMKDHIVRVANEAEFILNR